MEFFMAQNEKLEQKKKTILKLQGFIKDFKEDSEQKNHDIKELEDQLSFVQKQNEKLKKMVQPKGSSDQNQNNFIAQKDEEIAKMKDYLQKLQLKILNLETQKQQHSLRSNNLTSKNSLQSVGLDYTASDMSSIIKTKVQGGYGSLKLGDGEDSLKDLEKAEK